MESSSSCSGSAPFSNQVRIDVEKPEHALENLQIAHKVGLYILSLFADEDPNEVHKTFFEKQEELSYTYQMKQGIVLEIKNGNMQPWSLYTRLGVWQITKFSRIDSKVFQDVFQALSKTLSLQKMEDWSNKNYSYWEIRMWDGRTVEKPLTADGPINKLSEKDARTIYEGFKKSVLEAIQK